VKHICLNKLDDMEYIVRGSKIWFIL